MEGVVYYELLKPNETITTERYQQQLERLNDNLMQKRPSIASNRRKVILLHDNARPHVTIAVKQTDRSRMGGSPAPSVFSGLSTKRLSSVPIDATCSRRYTLL